MKKLFALLVLASLALAGCLHEPAAKPAPSVTPEAPVASTSAPLASKIIIAASAGGAPLQSASKFFLSVSKHSVSVGGETRESEALLRVELLGLRERGEAQTAAVLESPPGKLAGLSLTFGAELANPVGSAVRLHSPSDKLSFDLGVEIAQGNNLLVLEFQPADSLHETNTDSLVFLPVVRVLRAVPAAIPSGVFKKKDFSFTEVARIGMNERGEVGTAFVIPKEVNFTVPSGSGGGQASPTIGVDVVPPEIPFG